MKINIIIPALEKNNYSSRGDLLKWGDSNLLEWKIHQALQIKGINKIIVSSPSKSIAKIVGKYNITFHLRKKLHLLINFTLICQKNLITVICYG